MEQERSTANFKRDVLTRRDYRFILVWVTGLLLLYTAGILVKTRLLSQYKAEAEKIRQFRLESPSIELNAPVPEAKQGKTVDVVVGISVRRISELALA